MLSKSFMLKFRTMTSHRAETCDNKGVTIGFRNLLNTNKTLKLPPWELLSVYTGAVSARLLHNQLTSVFQYCATATLF